jgi:hypothetical protein
MTEITLTLCFRKDQEQLIDSTIAEMVKVLAITAFTKETVQAELENERIFYTIIFASPYAIYAFGHKQGSTQFSTLQKLFFAELGPGPGRESTKE